VVERDVVKTHVGVGAPDADALESRELRRERPGRTILEVVQKYELVVSVSAFEVELRRAADDCRALAAVQVRAERHDVVALAGVDPARMLPNGDLIVARTACNRRLAVGDGDDLIPIAPI